MNLLQTLQAHAAWQHPDSMHKTVGVDFDGVLCQSEGPYEYGHFGPPISEGLKLVRLLMEEGYNVKIFTARKETDQVAVWLAKQGLQNMHVTNQKVPATAYVDDRAIPWSSKKSTAEEALEYIKHPGKTLALKVGGQ